MTATHIQMTASKPNPTGLLVFSPLSSLSPPPPCPDVSLLCVSNTGNWHAVNGEIFKGRPGLPVSHGGLLFTPSPLLRNQNSLDVTGADWSSAPAPEQSLSQRWQASLELSVRPWQWGSAAGHPQGPISAGVPGKGPSNDPVRRRCNLASLGLHAHPPLITINSTAPHFQPRVFEL